MWSFKKAAKHCVKVYGVQYEHDEDNFFVCPECADPIYFEDYGEDGEYDLVRCPICGFNFLTGEDESDLV